MSSTWGAVLVTLAMQGCCMEVWKLQRFAVSQQRCSMMLTKLNMQGCCLHLGSAWTNHPWIWECKVCTQGFKASSTCSQNWTLVMVAVRNWRHE